MARRFLNGSSKAEAQGVMLSVEEPGLRRRPPLRQHRQLGGGLFALQMRQNPLDHRRVFNAGNDLDLTTAPLAGLDVNVKYAFESLHPGHRRMALGGRLVQEEVRDGVGGNQGERLGDDND
jgi:hypothetical protein